MFEAAKTPRLFAVPPGVDFPAALIGGLRARLRDAPPHAMAQVDLIVNTRRMARRLRSLFDAGPPGFLPRIHLVTQLDRLVPGHDVPAPLAPLRRRLELTRLVSSLLDADGNIAPRSSLYGLSDSLASLIDEMQGEGVEPEAIATLDESLNAQHWQTAKKFLEVVQRYLDHTGDAPDSEARQRLLVEALSASWAAVPPENPVIVAGSTGSRGTTSLLMQAVSRLPQGALVLPGFDTDLPPAAWAALQRKHPPEDHPQYRFFALMQSLKVTHAAVTEWHDVPPPAPARNRLVSLALRPAPVTDTWIEEGPALGALGKATEDLTLLEAPSPRVEALAIAMRLRQAVEDRQIAALITPDRLLTRRVTAALDRWNILPDDSAGVPLQLSPPGRFLRHIAALFVRPLDAEALLTLLKHPLTHTGDARNMHQLQTQRLEAGIRKEGLPFPTPEGLTRIASRVQTGGNGAEDFDDWLRWIAAVLCGNHQSGTRPLEDWVKAHLELAEAVAKGSVAAEDHALWQKAAGREARKVMDSLAEHAVHGGPMSARDYADLVGALLTGEEVRDRDAGHPQIMIWGTLEARVGGADLVILGGLNEGSWPEAPPPDPWLNRQMRLQAGLLLPERRIGLSAHDFQQAIAAPEVWLTRAIRSEDAETVPSRWISRLSSLMQGLPASGGPEAFRAMQDRGRKWLDQTRALEAFDKVPAAPRPAPRPPADARPRSLSVTEIQRLIRDPYAVYAKHCLKLKRVNDLVQSPDAPLRGTVMHRVMEEFIRSATADARNLTRENLLAITDRVLAEEAPWPTARLMWRGRIDRIAESFLQEEAARQTRATPTLFEEDAKGVHSFGDIGFTLIGKADRIDRTEQGAAVIYDYKTGPPPNKEEQKYFDKQLLLEAAMIEEGGFEKLGPAEVAGAAYIGLGSSGGEKPAPLAEEPPAKVLAELYDLVSAYLDEKQGFQSRRAVRNEKFEGEFDQLARFGEWDGTTKPTPEDLS